jgi:hypothetical protein
MKIVSLVVNILAIVNLILIVLASEEIIPHWYLVIGIAYAIFQLTYGIIRKESIFKFLR